MSRQTTTICLGGTGKIGHRYSIEDGLITALIDDSKKDILNDLADTATLLRETSDALQNGDGTAALLMRDPTL